MRATTILTKVLMAVTGLAWFVFVIGHLAGNLLIIAGQAQFNAYADMLESTGAALYVAEIGLIAFLATHVWGAIRATKANKAARPEGYQVKATAGKATLASRTMIVGGVILLVFIVTHVASFKFGDRPEGSGLWGLVVQSFKDPLLVAWYELAMVALGLHLSHGIGSAFQTLGFFKPAWRAKLKTAGVGLGWVLAAGFMVLPLWSFFAAKV